MSGIRVQSGDHSSVISHECTCESECGCIYVAATETSRADPVRRKPALLRKTVAMSHACRDKADVCGMSAEYEL